MATNEDDVVGPWQASPEPCPWLIPISGLACGHPVERRVLARARGVSLTTEYRCDGGGHVWRVCDFGGYDGGPR